MKNHLSIIVCGELDCGKSTLIGRLLFDTHSLSKEVEQEARETKDFNFAHLLDSLQEERQGQFTLDTTQAFLKYKKRQYTLIDVPGHRELLKNMLCGSSYADIAILVVDVQKSIEQQTKRHAFILKFLRIEQIIVVLNKMDLVGFNEVIFRKIKEEVAEFFKKIQLQPKYFIPISAKQGDNLCRKSKKIDWYKGFSLINLLNTFFKKKSDGVFRFPVQDIYNLDGKKVAVGAVVSGKLRVGERVRVMPSDKDCKVKAIKLFKRNMHFAKAPESIGLILDEMDDVSRGQIICKPRLPEVKTEILAKIFCAQPLNIKENLKFRCLTQESNSRIMEIIEIFDTANLEPKTKNNILDKNDSAQILLRTETPVVIETFESLNTLGRFVLQVAQDIAAVGIIS